MPQHLNQQVNRITRELTVTHKDGLHARPATEFVTCVLTFRSAIHIITEGKRYRADRIIDVLLANLDYGSVFVLEAYGPDAEAAVQRLEKLASFC
jgi:phosphotransferase system HPr (HPr) family protein